MLHDLKYFELDVPDHVHVHHACDVDRAGIVKMSITFDRERTVQVSIYNVVRGLVNTVTFEGYYADRLRGVETIKTTEIEKLKNFICKVGLYKETV